MKLIIQVPCLNEERNLPQVISGIPERIPGISVIETQIIDDGSTDKTVEIAQSMGVTHIIRNKSNRGLAYSFQVGIENALRQGADIIVNTDGDNQYDSSCIIELVKPIVDGHADIVLGDRQPNQNTEFSLVKRVLQKAGSSVVSSLAQVNISDAVSGFRAYSREAALGINVMTRFSYTTETLIHAGQDGLTIASVVVKTNTTERPSRLFKSMRSFVSKQAATILRSYVMYRPLNAFLSLGGIMILLGLLPILRFLYFFVMGDGDGKIQSLILGGVFLSAGYITIILALLSDTIATNRRLLEQVLKRVREIEMATTVSNENLKSDVPGAKNDGKSKS
ncbi:glycosyltransferase involved in cell wall biosynthesis [Yoonia maritima]|uniref:Glycosyltransferase involved in cell wall biosynthesis n=1 Tax=Yoonia maritima TaxID=1435347 RepID=A0A2T0VZQ2_9RHOB|nr:glycosyltransferase family 2 protein [Yoonia maritima]PRY77813.1 glycosyltransferase involved in cell wall biosynthesis [Yoonia maritima]